MVNIKSMITVYDIAEPEPKVTIYLIFQYSSIFFVSSKQVFEFTAAGWIYIAADIFKVDVRDIYIHMYSLSLL